MKRMRKESVFFVLIFYILVLTGCKTSENYSTVSEEITSYGSYFHARQRHYSEFNSAVAGLQHNDMSVREQAVEVLADLRDARAVEYLIHILNREQGNIRYKAVFALGEIRDSRAVWVLVELLKDRDWLVQKESAFALGKIKDVRAVDYLIDALKDEDADLRLEIAWALGEIGDEKAVEPLIELLSNRDVQKECAYAIRKIGTPAVALLVSALKNENDDIRRWSSEILGKMRDSSSVSLLIENLSDPVYGVDYAGALARIGSITVEPLISVLGDETKTEQAGNILVEIGRPSVWSLISLLKYRNRNINIQATQLLAEIGSDSVEPLISLLSHRDPVTRAYAVETLGLIKDTAAVVPLIRALKDTSFTVRAMAANSLGKIPDQRAINPLIHALNDVYWSTRYKAVYALGNIRDKRVVRPLVMALKDNDVRVQDEASWMLSKITGRRFGRNYVAWKKWMDENM